MFYSQRTSFGLFNSCQMRAERYCREGKAFHFTSGMCKYVGRHYIFMSLTFPQLAQAAVIQDAPIRPDSKTWIRSASNKHIAFNQPFSTVHFCAAQKKVHNFMWVSCCSSSLCFEAVWWSRVEGSLRGGGGGVRMWGVHCRRWGQVVSLYERQRFLTRFIASCTSSSSISCQSVWDESHLHDSVTTSVTCFGSLRCLSL